MKFSTYLFSIYIYVARKLACLKLLRIGLLKKSWKAQKKVFNFAVQSILRFLRDKKIRFVFLKTLYMVVEFQIY